MFGDFTASVVVLGCLLGWFGVLVGVRFVLDCRCLDVAV